MFNYKICLGPWETRINEAVGSEKLPEEKNGVCSLLSSPPDDSMNKESLSLRVRITKKQTL